MGYSDNPFNSAKGQELMKNIFNLMFIAPENSPSKIESKNMRRQVSHYKGNIVNIVNKMRKFVKGYQQVIISETASSGIHVCPHCRRRDAIWMWETVDAGHYASPNEWLSSVTLTKWNYGMADERGRYQFVVRYRCNDVTTCNDCHISVGGHGNTTCPNQISYTECNNCGKRPKNCTCGNTNYHRVRQGVCGSKNLSKVGCGEESYATHFMQEYTADDNHPQAQGEQTGAINRNRDIRVGRDIYRGAISGYEFYHRMVPDGVVVEEWRDIKRYVPSVKFTYTHHDTGNTKEEIYPVSELNYAISKQNLIQCVMGERTSGGSSDHAGKVYPLEHYGDPIEACEYCNATDYPPLQEVPNLYYKPRPMRIMNSQPLEAATASGGTYKRKPVYTLYLESPRADAYKLILPLPQIMTLNPIINEAQISTLSSAPNSCPNDVGAGAAETKAIEEANEELHKAQEKLLEQLTGGTALDEADAQTNKGFTFDVCEGRSRKAYYNNTKWIDDSPPCSSYRKDGSTLTKSREYPRWSKIPSYSPHAKPHTYYNEYLGPNPDTHFVMDWIKCSQSLNAFAATPPIYHFVTAIAETIDEDVGLIYEVLECKTCRQIVEAGGIIPYRQGLKQCDENGTSINDFSQTVLDAEMAYEQSLPTKNTKGEPVPTAWGIVASSDHNGQKMLLNPDLNIRIG